MASLRLWTSITCLLSIIQDIATLSYPLNVTIVSENFYNLLKWNAVDDDSNNTRYTVEVMKLGESWKVVPTCLKIHARECNLSEMISQNISNIYDKYWARVTLDFGENNATWVESEELQPYSQTVIGPPHLSFNCSNQEDVVALSMPWTPFKTNESRNMLLSEIFPGLKYVIKLYSESEEKEDVFVKYDTKLKETFYSFSNLAPSTNYCVTARLHRYGLHSRSHDIICCTTNSPEQSRISEWIIAVSGVTVLAVCSILLYWSRCCMHQNPEAMLLPKALEMINNELACKDKDHKPEGDHISSLSICQTYDWKPQFIPIQQLQNGLTLYEKSKNVGSKHCWSCSDGCQKQNFYESKNQEVDSMYSLSSFPFQDPSATIKSCCAATIKDFTPMQTESEELNVSHSQNLYKGFEACGVLTSDQTNILKDVKSSGLIDSLVACQSNISLSSVKLLTCEEIDSDQGNTFDSQSLESVSSLVNIYSVESQIVDDSDTVTQNLLHSKPEAEEQQPFSQESTRRNAGYKLCPILCEPFQMADNGYESRGKLL
ncbi:uncharacterized protein LOC122790097 [Protopterus annectens]|uniref:uncharacterized protein LOC122790097 n=1 Tax=Protopterus annectens TaxID=7888 RepID=UPI001CFC403A|nr:uncharacterized protein LOC122790097 [Protopterus annectens]